MRFLVALCCELPPPPQRNSSGSGSSFMGPTAPQINPQLLWGETEFMDGSTRFKKWKEPPAHRPVWIWHPERPPICRCFLLITQNDDLFSCRTRRNVQRLIHNILYKDFSRENSHAASGCSIAWHVIAHVCMRLALCGTSHFCFHVLNNREILVEC